MGRAAADGGGGAPDGGGGGPDGGAPDGGGGGPDGGAPDGGGGGPDGGAPDGGGGGPDGGAPDGGGVGPGGGAPDGGGGGPGGGAPDGGGGGPDGGAPDCGGGAAGGPPGSTIFRSFSVGGSRPTNPRLRPTSKVSRGPSGLPRLMVAPSWMSTICTRWPSTKIPLSELLSIAVHRPWSKRSSRWARAISGCATRISARRSLPMTTSRPAAKLPCERPDRTVNTGAAGRLIAV